MIEAAAIAYLLIGAVFSYLDCEAAKLACEDDGEEMDLMEWAEVMFTSTLWLLAWPAFIACLYIHFARHD